MKDKTEDEKSQNLALSVKEIEALDKPHPLGHKETKWKILTYLKENGQTSQGDLARRFEVHNSSIGDAKRDLLERDLIHTKKPGRTVYLQITEKGESWLCDSVEYYNALIAYRTDLKSKFEELGRDLRQQVSKENNDGS